jgi:galactonate dehydratase
VELMPDLAISDLALWRLREPVSQRAYTALRVTTRGGLHGWGECALPDAAEAARARSALAGKQASGYEAVRALVPASLQSGVNMALLDILGKAARAPVYQLLGGPTRTKVRALAAASDPAAARAAGYRACLLSVPPPRAMNHGQGYVLAVRRHVEQARTAAGDCDFVLDGGGALSPGDAAAIAADLERFHLLWLDEPCRTANLAALRKIAAECVTPVGAGRMADDAGAFQEMLREETADVLRPSLHRHGISHIRKIAAIAETYYVAVAPYHDGGPIATAAALHLAASLPNFFIQQIPFPAAEQDRRMRSALAGPVETVKDGFAALPVAPGLGITINESLLTERVS